MLSPKDSPGTCMPGGVATFLHAASRRTVPVYPMVSITFLCRACTAQPCPPLEPYVRLSPHTAHDSGLLRERSISPAPRSLHRGQRCACAGYLCTVSRPSPLGPSPSVLVLVHPAFLDSDYYAPFDCLQGLGAFGPGLPSLLPTLLAIPVRLSRVHSGELKQDAVGGVFLHVPSTLCGSLVVI